MGWQLVEWKNSKKFPKNSKNSSNLKKIEKIDKNLKKKSKGIWKIFKKIHKISKQKFPKSFKKTRKWFSSDSRGGDGEFWTPERLLRSATKHTSPKKNRYKVIFSWFQSTFGQKKFFFRMKNFKKFPLVPHRAKKIIFFLMKKFFS